MFSATLLSAVLMSAVTGDAGTDRKRAFDLISELGSPSFKAREKANTELAKLGGAAVDALREGVKNPDTEISERCRKLLPQAIEASLQAKIEQFLSKPNGPIPDDLPGLKRWMAIVGNTKDGKQLYGKVVKEHRLILLDIEQYPDEAPNRFQSFCQEIYNRHRFPNAPQTALRNIASESELLVFLFLGSDLNCRQKNGTAPTVLMAHANVFLNSTYLPDSLSGPAASDATKKLFLSWLEIERYPILMRRGFTIASNANLREAVPIAIKVAADQTAAPAVRPYGLLVVSKLVKADDVKLLKTLLEDKTVVGRSAVNGAVKPVELRDIALGIAVQATGQNTADYGFDRLNPNLPAAISFSYYAMSEEKREAAFKKWAEWSANQKK
jgi:hypothetical protein